jgi:hypothetical protein
MQDLTALYIVDILRGFIGTRLSDARELVVALL